MKRHPIKPIELLAAISVLALFAACGVVYAVSELLSQQTCYDNVYIDGQPVGGLTEVQIRETFRDTATRSPQDIPIIVGDSQWVISMKDINAHYDVISTQRSAMAVGRQGGTLSRLAALVQLRAQPERFTISLQYDENALRTIVDRIYNDVLVRAQDAKMDFHPDDERPFVVTNDVEGRSIDDDALLATLTDHLGQGNFDPITVQTQRRDADITATKLEQGIRLIASYTTTLTDDSQRNQNIQLVSTAINGTVLQSGDTFSFNTATGPRSSQKGYVDAPVISNKQLVDGPGGGVCQVSTTLYLAAALSGAKILERTHHSWPLFYVPAGMDSTVDYGRKDLRFQNTSDSPMYLIVRTDLEAKTVVVNIYGAQPENAIDIDAQTLETIQPDQPQEVANPKKYVGYRQTVTEEHAGCRVKVYRVFSSGGKELRRELLSEDYYAPVQGVVEVGTKVRSGDPNGGK